MRVLRERETWRRPPSHKKATSGMTPERQRNVARSLKALKRIVGSWAALAERMGSTVSTVVSVTGALGCRRIGAGLALRTALAADVPVDDILSGRWASSEQARRTRERQARYEAARTA
jgi:hypothetical protein